MTTIEVPSNGALFWATHRRQGRTGPMRCTKLLGNGSARLIPTHRERALSHLSRGAGAAVLAPPTAPRHQSTVLFRARRLGRLAGPGR